MVFVGLVVLTTAVLVALWWPIAVWVRLNHHQDDIRKLTDRVEALEKAVALKLKETRDW